MGESEEFRPREKDSLVEPLFGGLGVDSGEAPEAAPMSLPARLRAWWRSRFSSRNGADPCSSEERDR